MTDIDTVGMRYQRARKPHTCWGCASAILPGEKYWRSTYLVDGKIATIKTCAPKCECVVDMIDQHQYAMRNAVFYKTLPGYLAEFPDTFKDED